MAVTLLEQPTPWQPVYNPIIYRFTSDIINSFEGFKFEVDIYVSKIQPYTSTFEAWRKINTLEVPPGPDGTATIYIHKYVANELTSVKRFDKTFTTKDVVNNDTIGDGQCQYKVVVKERFLNDFRWIFDKIIKYQVGGINRPEFQQITPVTNHTLSQFPGELIVVSVNGGDPTGEVFDGRMFKMGTDGSLGANSLKTQDAQWSQSSTSTYNKTGDIKLATKKSVIGDIADGAPRGTWNGVKPLEDWMDWVEPRGEGTISIDDDYIYRAVPQDYYFQRLFTLCYENIEANCHIRFRGETLENSYRFITSLPESGTKLQPYDHLYVGFNPPRYTGGTKLKVRTDNGVFIFDLMDGISSAQAQSTILSIGIGPHNLIGVTPESVLVGALPIIDDNTTKVEWWYSNSSGYESGFFTGEGPKYSIIYSYDIEPKCSIYDKYSLLYLDKWGSYVPFPFYLVKEEKVKIDRQNYRKNVDKLITDKNGNDRWGYDLYDRGLTNLDTTISRSFKLTSDWLSDTEKVRVEDLLQSPEVYITDEDGVVRAINITNSSYESKDRRKNQLINYVIVFDYAQKTRMNS